MSSDSLQFLARGYKVGRVEQSETALGAEMRKAADKGKGKAGKEDKIVGRSLKGVFTSGTLVDGVTEDMGNHCVCIKVSTCPSLTCTRLDSLTGNAQLGAPAHFWLCDSGCCHSRIQPDRL
jgi:DNA mismatch repair ATPase MutS